MKYTLVYGGLGDCVTVDGGVTRHSVAAECRVAALELVNATGSFGKAALARWLTGSYARATRHGFHGDRVLGIGVTREVAPIRIQELVRRVRREAIEVLVRASVIGNALELAGEAIDIGAMKRAVDPDGAELWLPVDGAKMRLRDRLRSLLAADYANDPNGYADLAICEECSRVVFDVVAREHGLCAAHRRVSGVLLSPVLPELPRAASGE